MPSCGCRCSPCTHPHHNRENAHGLKLLARSHPRLNDFSFGWSPSCSHCIACGTRRRALSMGSNTRSTTDAQYVNGGACKGRPAQGTGQGARARRVGTCSLTLCDLDLCHSVCRRTYARQARASTPDALHKQRKQRKGAEGTCRNVRTRWAAMIYLKPRKASTSDTLWIRSSASSLSFWPPRLFFLTL